jgi:hypothetical protein
MMYSIRHAAAAFLMFVPAGLCGSCVAAAQARSAATVTIPKTWEDKAIAD